MACHTHNQARKWQGSKICVSAFARTHPFLLFFLFLFCSQRLSLSFSFFLFVRHAFSSSCCGAQQKHRPPFISFLILTYPKGKWGKMTIRAPVFPTPLHFHRHRSLTDRWPWSLATPSGALDSGVEWEHNTAHSPVAEVEGDGVAVLGLTHHLP